MKKMFLFGVLTLLLISCNNNPNRVDDKLSGVGEIFTGEHKLRRFKVQTTKDERWRASYFLIGGSAQGGTFTNTQVSFSFQLPDTTYAMATLPYQRIRVKIDSTISEPFVTFKWKRGGFYSIEYAMKHDIYYMLVHCKEEDFPMDVQIDEL